MVDFRSRFIVPALFLIPFALILDACLRPITEPDIFFYLALVKKYLSTGIWPQTDPFWIVPNQPLHSLHQWLGYWLFYVAHSLAGWAGIIWLKTLVILIFFGLPLFLIWYLYRDSKWTLGWGFTAGLFTLTIFSTHHRFRERASLFGELAVELLVAGLLFFSQRKWFWWVLPVLFWVWAQLHPSYWLGFAILAVYAALHWREVPYWSVILSVAVPALHPNGWEGYTYPLSFAAETQKALTQHVYEWMPLWDVRIRPFLFLYIPYFSLVPLNIYLWWRSKSRNWFALLLIALSTFMMTKSVRFGLSAQLILLLTMVELVRGFKGWKFSWLANVFFFSLGVAAFGLRLYASPNWRGGERGLTLSYEIPVKAAQELKSEVQPLRAFNSFQFGGYLAFEWQGDPKVFMHGFITDFNFYERKYQAVQYSRETLDATVNEFQINGFLLSKAGPDIPLIQLIAEHPDWTVLYQDRGSVVFVPAHR